MKKITNKPQATAAPKKRGPTRNVTAGHNWERFIVNTLKELGFENVCTTRIESKARDAQKVDIMNKDEYKNGRLPFNIQCKNLVMATRKTTLAYPDFAYPDILNAMPQDGSEINVIFHNMTVKKGRTFKSVGQYAHLKLYPFLMMMKELHDLRTEVALLKEGKLTA